MQAYVAHYEHDGRAWVVRFDEPDISTFGRSLRAAKRYARELLAVYFEVNDLVMPALARTLRSASVRTDHAT